jgi:replication factor C large subunit
VQTSQKDERTSIFELIKAIHAGADDNTLLRYAREVDATPDTIEQWIEESVTSITGAEEKAYAYETLAGADRFIGRTYRRQYYTLWKYASALMVMGTAEAAGGRGIHARIMPPERWRKMGTGRKQKTIRAGVMGKLADTYHIPGNALREDFFTPITKLVEAEPEVYARALHLDRDELEFFIGDKTRAAAIAKELAKERREEERGYTKKKVKKGKKTETAEKAPQEGQPTLSGSGATPEASPSPAPTHAPTPKPANPTPAPKPEPDPEPVPDRSQRTLFDGF